MSEFQGPGGEIIEVTPTDTERIRRFLVISDRILSVLRAPTAAQLLVDRDMAELRAHTKTALKEAASDQSGGS